MRGALPLQAGLFLTWLFTTHALAKEGGNFHLGFTQQPFLGHDKHHSSNQEDVHGKPNSMIALITSSLAFRSRPTATNPSLFF
jgi:hypothetical protein